MALWRSRLAEAGTASSSDVAVDDVPEATPVGNASYDWDAFDPLRYLAQNFTNLEPDDRKIVQLMRDFFTDNADPSRPVPRGIDVGSGSNLYPALAMLPFCKQIELREFGRRNVAWLKREVQGYSPVWDQYWNIFATRQPYHAIDDPRKALAAKARVFLRDIFLLPPHKWDMGTMSFVAESISDEPRQFNEATERFIKALKPGAPFAATFMRNSSGYIVGTVRYPAVAIQEADVEQCLTPHSHDLKITVVTSEAVRRTGYHNMIVATGKAGRGRH